MAGSTVVGERGGYRRTLGERPFLFLWSSQLVSQSGDFIFEVALIWLVLQTTGSVLAVGLVVTATLVPGVVLGPFLGVLVDRGSRRSLLLVTNVVEGVAVAALSGLVLAHALGFGILLALVAGLGAAAQIVRIASQAMIPQTVGVEDLARANALFSFGGSLNQVVGLSLGGVVVATLGVTLPIEYDALSFFIAAALVALVPRRIGSPEPPPEGGRPRFAAQFAEGFAYLRRQRYLVEVIVLGVVINFFANAVGALWAPYAARVLHGSSETYGFLGATLALGSLLGALVAGQLDARRSAGRYLFGGAAGVGAAILGLGVSTTVLTAFPSAFALGFLISVTNVPMFALIQAKVPARLMGRLMSVLLSLLLAAAPFGTFFAGSFAAGVGIGAVFVVAAGTILATVAFGVVAMRELRDITY